MSELTPPNSGFLGPKEEATANAQEIVKEGGLAWVQAEYGPDMGVDNVYWGHRVYFFTAEQIVQRRQDAMRDAAAESGELMGR